MSKVPSNKVPEGSKITPSKVPEGSKVTPSKVPDGSKVTSSKVPEGSKVPDAGKCPPEGSKVPEGSNVANSPSKEEKQFFICGNWKMNGSKETIPDVVKAVTEDHTKKAQIVLAVPSCYIEFVKGLVAPGVSVGAQNIYHDTKGAFTGEVSADMVKDVGAEWVIAGSSERRQLFGEADECTNKKIANALCASLNVIVCIGETKAEREHGHTNEVLARQLLCVKSAMGCSCGNPILIAYEPVWSKGTGIACSTEQAQEIHAYIRDWLKKNISEEVGSKTRLLYGGSVTTANASELTKQTDIDGFYIGEESFSTDFAKIIKSCKCGC